uniref:Uncharacterized protein n=1 Tax=Aureimonas altamirensis TaxID=370622 RepID=A0A0P0YXE9_9HYPH|nr:hypothetical protein [Aureimonas altamirensis]
MLASDQPDDARPSDAAMHLRTHALELCCDDVGRTVLFEADFRMRMQIVANSLEITGKFLNPGQYRHVVSFV